MAQNKIKIWPQIGLSKVNNTLRLTNKRTGLHELLPIPATMQLEYASHVLSIKSPIKAQIGTISKHVYNHSYGVLYGFHKRLELLGINYKALRQGKDIVLQLGINRPLLIKVPQDLKIVLISKTGQHSILIFGPNKEKVGIFASKLRMLQPAEPYKGIGFRYANERIVLKEGKK